MEGITAVLQKWRVRLGHIFALAIMLFAQPKPAALIIGTVIALIGEGVRIYSAGLIEKDTVLSRRGPYAYTRNPLYAGSFLMYLGFSVAASKVYIVAAFIIFFYVVYYATIIREESFLRIKFGAEYEAYCREVPRFLPRLTTVGGGAGEQKARFEWRRVTGNREYEALAATIIVLALLWTMNLTGWNAAGLLK